MLYTNWRSYRNLFVYPVSVAFVLSSDVHFINVVKETDQHVYFFGHEVNKQYGINNQDDRSSWQSFMLRICKNDLGFKVKYNLDTTLNLMTNFYNNVDFGIEDVKLSPGYDDLKYNKAFPTRHFVTSLKVNFGCYVSKRPRAISDNHFWGETNVVYLNRLADVIFDRLKKITFKTKNIDKIVGCKELDHSQLPLLGLFNGPGIVGTGLEPTGALCQLQLNRNIFIEEEPDKKRYSITNSMNVFTASDEIMSISSTSTANFFENSLFRTNGVHKLTCTNAEFWRGDIVWKQNDKDVIMKDAETFMFINRNPSSAVTISCYGVNNDHDRLYENSEYAWITQKPDLRKDVLLNKFMISEDYFITSVHVVTGRANAICKAV